MLGQVDTALVLAGGKGERLRPLTDDRPKPMVEVGGRPILEHHLRWLRGEGIVRAVLLTGYLGVVVEDYFSVDRVPGLQVECVRETSPLGRGGAIRNGWEQACSEASAVVATNGDVLTGQSLAEMVATHQRSGALATILLKRLVSQYGIVDVDEDNVVRNFREKPELPYWFNAGVYVLDGSLKGRFPSEGDHEAELFPQLAREGNIVGCACTSYWQSVESQKDMREAERLLAGATT